MILYLHRSNATPTSEEDIPRSCDVRQISEPGSESPRKDKIANSPSETTEPIYATIRKPGSSGSPRADPEQEEGERAELESPVPPRKTSPPTTAAQNGSAIRVRLENCDGHSLLIAYKFCEHTM